MHVVTCKDAMITLLNDFSSYVRDSIEKASQLPRNRRFEAVHRGLEGNGGKNFILLIVAPEFILMIIEGCVAKRNICSQVIGRGKSTA